MHMDIESSQLISRSRQNVVLIFIQIRNEISFEKKQKSHRMSNKPTVNIEGLQTQVEFNNLSISEPRRTNTLL